MARLEEFWIQIQNVFDPEEVLVGQRGADFYCESEDSPFDDIRLNFRPTVRPSRPAIGFFSGHRGSGKSSMLFRLLEHLKRDYFLVYFDIEHNLDSRKANQIDLLYLLGATIFHVADKEGINPAQKNLIELAESVYTVTLQRRSAKERSLGVVEAVKNLVCFGASMLGGSLAGELARAALKPLSFTSGVSETKASKREVEPRVQDIINNVNLIIADVGSRPGSKPVLVVVDGLDKLQRIEQAKLIFLESRALKGPVCRIIYTVPMLLASDFGQLDGQVYLLSNVKLYEKTADNPENQPYGAGYETMREVVQKRLHTLHIQPGDVFETDALNRLIFKSGGVMRLFIELVQNACTTAERMKLDKVTATATQEAIRNQAARLAIGLDKKKMDELQKVRTEKRPSGNKESSELLHGRLIVAYRDHQTWFDAHPLIWDEMS